MQHTLSETMIRHDADSLVSYKGPVDAPLISTISQQFRNRINRCRAVERLCAIIIELAQNIQFYSAEKISYGKGDQRVGWIQVFEKESKFILRSGNAVRYPKVNKLVKQCELISTLDKEGLRRLKRSQRSNSRNIPHTGAGIGLIQVALLSRNPVDFEVIQINEEYAYFIFKITINKK